MRTTSAALNRIQPSATLAMTSRVLDLKAKGVDVKPLDDAVLAKWKDVARASAWKDYAAKSENCARLLKLAEQVVG